MIAPYNVPGQIYLFYQHYSGDLRYSELTDNGWQGGGSAEIAGFSSVKNGTHVAGCSGELDDVIYVRNSQALANQTKILSLRDSSPTSCPTSSTSIHQGPCKKSTSATTAPAAGPPATSAASTFAPLTATTQPSPAAGINIGTGLTPGTAAECGFTLGVMTALSTSSRGTLPQTYGALATHSRTVTAMRERNVGREAQTQCHICTCRMRNMSWSCGGKITIPPKRTVRHIRLVYGIKVSTTSPMRKGTKGPHACSLTSHPLQDPSLLALISNPTRPSPCPSMPTSKTPITRSSVYCPTPRLKTLHGAHHLSSVTRRHYLAPQLNVRLSLRAPIRRP